MTAAMFPLGKRWMNVTRATGLFLALVAVLGCGDDDQDGAGAGGGAGSSDGGAGASGSGGTSGASGHAGAAGHAGTAGVAGEAGASGASGSGSTSTPVYVSVTSHNEDDSRYDAPYASAEGFLQMRNAVLQIAELTNSYGAVYEFQTDWRFLKTLEKYETDVHRQDTNGKTFLRYLSEDLGVIVEAHSHECGTLSPAAASEYPEYASGCNYADVVYLIEQFGVAPPPVVGGFLATPPETAIWEKFWLPVQGQRFPSHQWQAEILWGGGSFQHTEDLSLAGVWRPKSHEEYTTDDASRELINVPGGGAACVIPMVDAIASGELSANRMYTASATFFELNVFENSNELAKIQALFEQLAPHVASGAVVYEPLPRIRELWKTEYQSQPNIVDLTAICGEQEESCEAAGTCPTDTICCPSPLPCAGQCIHDCRVDGVCPAQAPVCDTSSGLCHP
jgi:hypothetical protein